jgi:uncharacterized caspase-like protein
MYEKKLFSLGVFLLLISLTSSTFSQKDLRTANGYKQSNGYVGVALLIGNSDYQFATKLNSPVNNANDLAKVLKELGFKILPVRANATLAEMETAIAEFERELAANTGVGVFYYSGHGIQSKGLNYLLPTDANIPTEAFLRQKAIDLESVMETMEGATKKVKIVILDACRNDPFKDWKTKGGNEKWLAKVDALNRMLIAYATSPKKTAADGTNRNSPYTEILLQEISKPNISINDMLQKVRTNLASKYNQTSWENTSLLERFCFGGCEGLNIASNSNNSSSSTQNSSNKIECANCISRGPEMV